MAYEAPKITEAGRFSDVTRGDKLDLSFEDSVYVWGLQIPVPFGSR
ncbi:lasso RiPP family leader peptide-containing protein [Microbacterium ulmi]|uniref:Lasso RiPP family leader peptide-containing protein n=1 Tax=Microbacterium ulmi TaxID=179095 RepID=A0A7Y2LZQ2_9MICO|nr:lasso RiPP family leader peptide-containing protein [Microbacterium ulmi]NII69737.1 hypothetical protein [Microbacterium ulmi]NNH03289.1 lasso RiPP family leader peptide-containing protein [Microbacterium ulmi]